MTILGSGQGSIAARTEQDEKRLRLGLGSFTTRAEREGDDDSGITSGIGQHSC